MASNPQRAYRAACPNCGAPVEFASAASSSAVCSFCRSTLLRDGESLRRIGVSAELFDDHSPLQLGASGRHLGVAFTLVGRLQVGYAGGTWNEWHALFDAASGDASDGAGGPRSGWLSEDNGAYVIAFDAPTPADAPTLAELRAGTRTVADGRAWDVASVQRAKLLAAQGELPTPPKLDAEFTVVDLRNAQGEVATLDDAQGASLQWSVGRAVALSELAMQGLREAAEKTLASRAIECPSCGAALTPSLASTQSIACTQCKAVVDISKGAGAELAHYAQNNAGEGGLEPQIALGTTGTLALGSAALPWQVVGYLERCELPEPGDDEEFTYWREYLLYNVSAGFAFLVDAEDGWSWARPITGAPALRGEQATWKGAAYLQRYHYRAKVSWVLGEFYWRVQREERAVVSDFHGGGAAASKRLSREESRAGGDSEVTWSEGEMLPSAAVAKAFGLAGDAAAAMQRDVAPMAGVGGGRMLRIALIMLVLFIVVATMLSRCGDDRCDTTRASFGNESQEYRQCLANRGSGVRSTGGSYGGYTSGGGHK